MIITRKQKCEEKQLYGRFKRQINNISLNKTWSWIRKGNFKEKQKRSTKQRYKNQSYQGYMHNPALVLQNDKFSPMGVWHTHGSPNLGQKTRPYNNQPKKERICKIADFAVLGDHRIKLKKCKKKDRYLDLSRELKKIWNMLVTIIPIVIGAFRTVTKGLVKGLGDLEVIRRVETTQSTTLLRTARIPRRVLETWGDLLSLKSPVNDH